MKRWLVVATAISVGCLAFGTTFLTLQKVRADNARSTLPYKECMESFEKEKRCGANAICAALAQSQSEDALLQKKLNEAQGLGDSKTLDRLQKIANLRKNPDLFCRDAAEWRCGSLLGLNGSDDMSDDYLLPHPELSGEQAQQCTLLQVKENRAACERGCLTNLSSSQDSINDGLVSSTINLGCMSVRMKNFQYCVYHRAECEYAEDQCKTQIKQRMIQEAQDKCNSCVADCHPGEDHPTVAVCQ